jgi:dihydroorotase
MLWDVLPHTAKWFKRAVVMPNTKPAIRSAAAAIAYRKEILNAAHGLGIDGFEPLMTIEITEEMTPSMIHEASKADIVAGKIYPRGRTTNSADGVLHYELIYPVLGAMQDCDMLALFHGESPEPGVFCLDREEAFLETLEQIALDFPRLRIVMEHVTTKAAVECVKRLPENVAATITVHHLFLTLDDVVGDMLSPHHFCKPLAKRPEDCEELRRTAFSGNPKFFLGTDSAPHLRGMKECASGCAGVYTAPVAIPLLFQLFEEQSVLGKFPDFTSRFGADFYDIPRNEETITLVRKPWMVLPTYDGVVPFMAGKKLQWWME